MSIRNPTSVTVAIDISLLVTPSNSRPMSVATSLEIKCDTDGVQVNSQLSRLSSKGLKDIEDELKGWQEELSNLRRVQPMAGTVEELKTDGISKLEKQVQEETVKLEQAQDEVEEVSHWSTYARR